MRLELVFAVFGLLVILLLDCYSRIIAVTTFLPVFYFFLQYFWTSFDKRFVVLAITKLYFRGSTCVSKVIKTYQYITRIFNFRKPVSVPSSSIHRFVEQKADLKKEINILVSKISQYYIHSWYYKLTDQEEFNSYLNSTITDALVSLCTKVSKVEKKKFSYAVLQIYKHFLSHFLELTKETQSFKWQDFKMTHWAMKDSSTEWCYLQSLVSEVIDLFGPTEYEKTVHSKYSPLIHAIIIEILTENLINRIIGILSDSSFLNFLILKVLLNCSENKASLNSNNRKKVPSQAASAHNTNPVILFEEDTHFNKSNVGVADTNVTSQYFLTIPQHTSYPLPSVSSKTLAVNFNKECQHGHKCFSCAGCKSASNINLSENVSVPLNEGYVTSSDIKMKRSKSADSIRQMSHLKPLNYKDYNILPKGNSMIIDHAAEAVEVPTLFTDVQITGTLQENDTGLLPYTLYCIKYYALFHDTEKSTEIPHFVKQAVTIRRRFREFLTLQSRLENNPVIKSQLKGIKGPSKGLPIPFSNLDKKNIAERKIFLEKYLNDLCNIASISQSCELQEFLAYGIYGAEAGFLAPFVRKNADIGVPRIDKMFVRGFKGAIDIFKTALPLDGVMGPFGEDQDEKFQEHLIDYSSREPTINKYLINNYLYEKKNSIAFAGSVPENDIHIKKCHFKSSNHNTNTIKCCNRSTICDDIFTQDNNPIGNSILELISMATKVDDMDIDGFLSILKLLFAPCIDRYLTEKINNLTEDHLAMYLHLLHTHMWPDETVLSKLISIEPNVNKIMDYFEELLPLWNIHFLKRKLLDSIKLLLLSIQNQESNKCLLFHIFDAILEAVCYKKDHDVLWK